jgi:CheY-like chemotaxis protein
MFNAATAIDRTRIGTALSGQTINALLLDDSKFDRVRIRRMSREAGIPIYMDEAVSLEALKLLLDEESFDVILLDYRLESGDGIQALEMVRAHPINSQCPAIMVSGIADPDVAVRAMRLGCSDYLAKSELDAEGLRNAVVQAIEKAAVLRGSERSREEATKVLVRAMLTEVRNSLQPEFSAMVRCVRGLRAQMDHPDFNLGAALDELDARSMGMWALMSQLVEHPPGEIQFRAAKRAVWPQ